MSTFVVIDLETADYRRDSAFVVRIVKVRGTRIVHETAHLIRSPLHAFLFSWQHGNTWEDVARETSFRQV